MSSSIRHGFPLGRKVFTYLNANVVKVFKDARDDGVKKLHPPLEEDVIRMVYISSLNVVSVKV